MPGLSSIRDSRKARKPYPENLESFLSGLVFSTKQVGIAPRSKLFAEFVPDHTTKVDRMPLYGGGSYIVSRRVPRNHRFAGISPAHQ